ncbi:winged helix DNA-binding domain-containing protein [Odoribacter sp. AF15-53]|uniref:winged helix DNA-binding domain-containing protein n=1 Tax=Odoribacter sp. AF15-53 TaxID=2292236 RepID=UPI000E48E1C0|nr:winged helix DNA-binding domain-containing protein [Odoribacter sp. AF15-53]RHR82781.1 winged helix DNA-binding domain-containing protein [Odoribacter sp. AF15-53]
MITDIRLRSQQLVNPGFDDPRELVAWMGAIQGQDYNMAKWAVGVRLKKANLQKVEEALEKGEILRTHVMRPTWHLVAAEDIRWMIKLSGRRIKSAYESYWRHHEITEELHGKCNDLIVAALEGNKSLTRQEIGEVLSRAGIVVDDSRIGCFVGRAEVDGVICSGVDKGKQRTYALLDERVPATSELHREEALAKLAIKYFRSHSPASLQDFVWWSGLSVSEAKQAIGLIDAELITERMEGNDWFIHESCGRRVRTKRVLHLLPSYDEYLISYKDRSMSINPEYYAKAFNTFGLFYPVILCNGKIVGNWKMVKRKQTVIESSFFVPDIDVDEEELSKAKERFRIFNDKDNG